MEKRWGRRVTEQKLAGKIGTWKKRREETFCNKLPLLKGRAEN